MRPLLIILLMAPFISFAQVEREEPAVPESPVVRLANDQLSGKVVDGQTHRGMAGFSVQLYARLKNSSKDSLVAGMFTSANGDFNFTNLPDAESFRLLVTGIGYRSTERNIVVSAKSSRFTADLGNIEMEQEAAVMSNVLITTERPALRMGIDRKIFSVDKSLTSTGGTALDVMKNIPSVTVDVEGNVQLRRAQPQVFVDGRPTILSLDQIPADQIERVELITNPSAKFDASSSAGIINIVMKRNRKMGLNGVATASAGYPEMFNANLSVNARQGKFNFFVSGGYYHSSGMANSKTLRQNRQDGNVENYFNQYGVQDRNNRFASLRFGLDYFASNRTTVSITQHMVDGRFKNSEDQDQEYLNRDKISERTGKRRSEDKRGFGRFNTQLNMVHRFAKQGRELSAGITYNKGNGNDHSLLNNSFFYPSGQPFGDPAIVRNEGHNYSRQYTLQADYEDAITQDAKLEAGIRTSTNRQESYFSAFAVNNGQESLLPLSNNYAYTETVHAAYLSYSGRLKSITYQAGLRSEVSNFKGRLIDSARSFGYHYPGNGSRFFDALFPSLFLTKNLGENSEVQLNYSRRIRRPNFWQLNPFIDINDPVNLRQGNPQLKPEFTNSLEFNYSLDYDKGNFLGVIYYRNNMHDITRYSDTIKASLYQQLNNAAIDPNALLNTFINAHSTNRLGLELTLQHTLFKGLDITPTVDLQYRKVNADQPGLGNSGINWDGKLTLNYKLPEESQELWKNLGLQLTGEYESREVTLQGRNLPQYSVDFGLRKEFGKEHKASLSFNVNDLFNTDRHGSIYDTEFYFQESYHRRHVRNFRLSFTLKFGKEEFQVLHRKQQDNHEDE